MKLKSILRNPHCYTHTSGLGNTHCPCPPGKKCACYGGYSMVNLGQTQNLPPGYLVGGLGLGGMLLTGGLVALLVLRR